jgi:hypothetical protein
MMSANTVLESLSASNIYDLRGVAIVTGGGTVRGLCTSLRIYRQQPLFAQSGDWANDQFDVDGQWSYRLYSRS